MSATLNSATLNKSHVDQILVMEHGVLIEAGTHQQLMAAGGAYEQLFSLQASGYRSQPAAVASDTGAGAA